VAGRSLIHFGEVAKQATKTATTAGSSSAYLGYAAAKWSRLATYDATAAPGYSFQIPPTAYTGQNFYVGFKLAKSGNTQTHVGLIQFITIDSGTASTGSTVAAESTSIWGTVIVSVLVTAAVAAVLFFFVL